MHRDAKIAIIIISLPVICICVACLLSSQPVEDNSRAYFRRYYGVSEETVRAVARAYGVDPGDLASYGGRPFPLNYIEHTLGWAWDQPRHPTIYRAEIEALVTGHVSRCDLGDTATLYLFYSDWLSPKTLFHGEALPMEVSYELDVTRAGMRDDQIVQAITFYNVGDSGGLPWEGIAPGCEPPARYAACDVRLPLIGCGIER